MKLKPWLEYLAMQGKFAFQAIVHIKFDKIYPKKLIFVFYISWVFNDVTRRHILYLIKTFNFGLKTNVPRNANTFLRHNGDHQKETNCETITLHWDWKFQNNLVRLQLHLVLQPRWQFIWMKISCLLFWYVVCGGLDANALVELILYLEHVLWGRVCGPIVVLTHFLNPFLHLLIRQAEGTLTFSNCHYMTYIRSACLGSGS